MDDRALDWATDTVLGAAARGETSASSTLFLLRRYVALGRPDVLAAVEAGLSHGLETFAGERDPRQRCEWLGLFADAVVFSDDPRLLDALQGAFAGTIDDLEQMVRALYEPGEGMRGATPRDQCRSASALLTAFEMTGRLPYSMLAEELLQVLRRDTWDDARGCFRAEFGINCDAVRVLSRFASLHRDADYTAAAIVASHATYDRDAERTLESLAPIYRDHESSAAVYGLALLDSFSLKDLPN